LGVGHKTLQFSPLIFDASVMEIFCTLCIGGTLVLVEDETRYRPLKLLRYVDEQKVNRINVPFVALQYFTETADAEQYFPQSLQEVISAGEQLKITPQVSKVLPGIAGLCVLQHVRPNRSQRLQHRSENGRSRRKLAAAANHWQGNG
jgi:non-ribosomal peptide synthetase component F